MFICLSFTSIHLRDSNFFSYDNEMMKDVLFDFLLAAASLIFRILNYIHADLFY